MSLYDRLRIRARFVLGLFSTRYGTVLDVEQQRNHDRQQSNHREGRKAMSQDRGVMFILKGINNLLHLEPAIEYALREGYVPEVLMASGETGEYSVQVNRAIRRIQTGDEVTALYGFSGGGYNTVHIYHRLNAVHKKALRKIAVIGAPGVVKDDFPGLKDVVIFNDPNVAHMEQPEAFLAST